MEMSNISSVIQNAEIRVELERQDTICVRVGLTVPSSQPWKFNIVKAKLFHGDVQYAAQGENELHGCSNATKLTFRFNGKDVIPESKFVLFYREPDSGVCKLCTWILTGGEWVLEKNLMRSD